MMQENMLDVALEVADYARISRRTGAGTVELETAIHRIFDADGCTSDDALAFLVYARLFLTFALSEQGKDDADMLKNAFLFVNKALYALEKSTGWAASELF